jgi:type IV pilus biogenesis protein CpaD/CtpE
MKPANFSALALFVLLAGCSGREHLRRDFGYSTQNNISVQVVDPAAAQRQRRMSVSDGQKMEQALKDYRKGRPEATREKLIITSGK